MKRNPFYSSRTILCVCKHEPSAGKHTHSPHNANPSSNDKAFHSHDQRSSYARIIITNYIDSLWFFALLRLSCVCALVSDICFSFGSSHSCQPSLPLSHMGFTCVYVCVCICAHTVSTIHPFIWKSVKSSVCLVIHSHPVKQIRMHYTIYVNNTFVFT